MRVLVLGGTGAMGSHLCRELVGLGHDVVCTTRRERKASGGVSYVVGDAKNPEFLDGLLVDRWGAIVDFMIWSTDEFRGRYRSFLGATDQYVFTSSYRVYADSPVITEASPRLLDAVDDTAYLATDEYALCKARCEDLLRDSRARNWTVVRPAVTYDGANGRLQLAVHEAGEWVWRARRRLPVPLPSEMLGRQATMSYGGDVARMIALLVGNPLAMGEAFTVSGSDHVTWGEVVEIYRSVLPLKIAGCPLDSFIAVRGGEYQIRYDRMFDRVVDNSKVLGVTGIGAGSLVGMREGLARELRVLVDSGKVPVMAPGLQGRFDKLCGGMPSFGAVARELGAIGAAKYLVRRLS